MIHLSLSQMANQLSSTAPVQDVTFKGVSTDTRHLSPGNLFVAIRGEKFDGHNFLAEAFKKGARAALVDKHIESPIPQLVVNDTLEALGKISAYWRQQFSLPLIGVTGSNGKTTLKNMIASILQAACQNEASHVLATEGNLNNNIGAPLMLCRLNENHRYGVIEMGMNHFGEIAYLTQLVKPNVAVINNAAAAHLEALQDVAGVAKAKGEIFFGLSQNGTAVLNHDDGFFDYWRGLLSNQRIITFGLQSAADVTASFTDNQNILLSTPQGKIEVTLPLLGRHNVMNALAATASTLAIGINLETIKAGLEKVAPAPGRLCQYVTKSGTRIIDDTYNANPASVSAAINTLAALSGTKILVLGDMKELGTDAVNLHFMTGQKAQTAGINFLFTLGELSLSAARGFGDTAQHFTDREELITALKPYLKNDTTILIKGSRSMNMEKVLAGLVPEIKQANVH